MSQEPHVADAEDEFKVTNIFPDMCRVGKDVVPFDIYKVITFEKNNYAQSVLARSGQVLMTDSIIKGVKGNMGQGVLSGVSKDSGHAKIIRGAETVFVEDRTAARDGDLVWMNGKAGG